MTIFLDLLRIFKFAKKKHRISANITLAALAIYWPGQLPQPKAASSWRWRLAAGSCRVMCHGLSSPEFHRAEAAHCEETKNDKSIKWPQTSSSLHICLSEISGRSETKLWLAMLADSFGKPPNSGLEGHGQVAHWGLGPAANQMTPLNGSMVMLVTAQRSLLIPGSQQFGNHWSHQVQQTTSRFPEPRSTLKSAENHRPCS